MSSKKDKLLESAQKFIAKGQLDRAIKDYEQVVALDSSDIRHRQRLAELLVRANRKEEAIGEYEAIGKHYSDHAFYLKAIAVYKQIQKLDPGNARITLSLASLNEKQGLIGNALAEYNIALSYYQKTRQLPEAIKVLEHMLAADPGNLNTLLKYAETYYSAGVHEKSYDHFTRLAVLLGKSGDESAFGQICNRVSSLFPDRKDFQIELMSTLIEDGCADATITHLQAVTGKDSGNWRAWELLAEAYGQQGDQEQYMATLQRMAGLFPEEMSFREKLGPNALDAGPGEPVEPAIVSPDVVSAEETAQPEPPGAETSPVADEPPVVAELDDSGNDEPWEEEIDLSLAGGQGMPASSPDADESYVRLDGETAGEEPAQATDEPVGQGREDSCDDASLPGDFSEIDLEIDEEEAVGSDVPESHSAGAYELPLSDDFSEIDLEIDEEEAVDSDVPEPHSVGAYELPLSDDFSEIDLEVGEEEAADSDVPEPHSAGAYELPLSDDFPEIDLEVGEEEAVDSGVQEPHSTGVYELSLSEDFSEIDMEADEEEAADSSVLESQDAGELSLSADVAETMPEIGEEAAPLSLVNLLEEAGMGESPSSSIAASESELMTEIPEEGEEDVLQVSAPLVPDGEGLFDLGAELHLEGFAGDEEEVSFPGETSKYSLDGVFSAFKQVVDRQLDQGDTETHYNLGIAYKEMGLYDDAIAEFQAAARATERTADCLTLQGICHREKGDDDSAEEAFRRGMALDGLPGDVALSLKYELALLLEDTGRAEESLQWYREVKEVDPGFREVGSRIVALSGDVEEVGTAELELLELEEEE